MSLFDNKHEEILKELHDIKAGIMDLKCRMADIEFWMMQHAKTGKKSVPIWKRWALRRTGFSKEL